MAKTFEISNRNDPDTVMQIQCDTLLREIVGKRQVWRGSRNGQPAIIKIFQSPLHKRRHLMREYQGLKKLHARKLEAPAILGYGRNPQGHLVLVLEMIQNTRDILGLQDEQVNHLTSIKNFSKILIYFARMHRAGVIQKDLHLGNFLWDGQTIFAIDPAEMRFSSRPISYRQCMGQLAKLMAIAFAYSPETYTALVKIYFDQQGWNVDQQLIRQIKASSYQKHRKTIERGLKKTLRSSTRFVKVVGNWEHSGVFVRDYFTDIDLNNFMKNLDRQMESGTILKNGRTSFVSKFQCGDHSIVAKRYNHKGWLHCLRHTIKGSRAKKCWLFGHRITGVKLSTAKPIAFIEQRKYGLIWQSYILTEYIDGPVLSTYLKESVSEQEKSEVICATDQLLKKISLNKMTHGDVKATNFLVQNGLPVLIDLDSMRRHLLRPVMKFYSNRMIKTFHRRLAQFLN